MILTTHRMGRFTDRRSHLSSGVVRGGAWNETRSSSPPWSHSGCWSTPEVSRRRCGVTPPSSGTTPMHGPLCSGCWWQCGTIRPARPSEGQRRRWRGLGSPLHTWPGRGTTTPCSRRFVCVCVCYNSFMTLLFACSITVQRQVNQEGLVNTKYR